MRFFTIGYTLSTLILVAILSTHCKPEEDRRESTAKDQTHKTKKLFHKKTYLETGIDFSNKLSQSTEAKFIQEYRYMFNGGGVAVGDINNDGLNDVFFTGNEVQNKLYLNEGDFRFKDISSTSGINQESGWCTGVSMIDINADGLLDIYICRSYHVEEGKRKNLLFINNGDNTFINKAEELGLDDGGFSTQAAFLDYDLDGLLDVFVVNHPDRWNIPKPFVYQQDNHQFPHQDRLYKNLGKGRFEDVSLKAGLVKEDWGGYGLGIAVGDLDGDQDPDVYIANDYEGPDYYYLNNGDGTFRESLKSSFYHTSLYSMGVDVADYNNDGLLDLLTLDMASEDHLRSKTQMRPMKPARFQELIDQGLPYQYMYNSLQTNNGNGTFSDLAQLCGIAKTDWSWAPLFADFDLDGLKDIFVSNGFRVDDMDNDYWAMARQKYGQTLLQRKTPELALEMLNEMPSTPLVNYSFQNHGDYKFTNTSYKWGLNHTGFTQGIAYGDLDGDGDLDLVMNNLNQKAWIYENNADELFPERKHMKIKLKGPSKNLFGIGAKLKLVTRDRIQYQEVYSSRGFQSSVPSEITFALPKEDSLVHLEITWPQGQKQYMKKDLVAGLNQIDYRQSTKSKSTPKLKSVFTNIDMKSMGIKFRHKENQFDDYKTETLLPYKYSMLGPDIAVGDINGDQLKDFFVGGAINQPGQVYVQRPDGTFTLLAQNWDDDKKCEDVGAVFFDYDLDGDQDLYVVSGGNEYRKGEKWLRDRLYKNNGSGQFEKVDVLPESFQSGSIVIASDIDEDGQQDLFIGGRQKPGLYPYPASSRLLINQGSRFVDKTQDLCPDLRDLGMITDALWVDIDGDEDQDLVVCGEWMPITIFINTKGKFKRLNSPILSQRTGWWYCLVSGDFDNDGDQDFVAGNLGLNYKYKASPENPFHVYANDFDQSGSNDIVLSYEKHGAQLPLRGRECSSEQMPFIKKKFPSYRSFGNATLDQIYGESLKKGLHYQVTTFASCYVENLGNLNFKFHPLPVEAQTSSIQSIVPVKINDDEWIDLIVAGNLYQAEIETPRNDASGGLVLLGQANGEFSVMTPSQSGFWAAGDVKDLELIELSNGKNAVLIGKNDDPMEGFRYQSTEKIKNNTP